MTAAAALASKFGNKFEKTRCNLASLDVGVKPFLGQKCLPASDDKILNFNKKLNASKLRFDIDGDAKAIETSKIQRIALESQLLLGQKFQLKHNAKKTARRQRSRWRKCANIDSRRRARENGDDG